MVALDFHDKERVYYHLGVPVSRFGLTDGYSFGGVPDWVIGTIEEACSGITSDLLHNKLLKQIDRCDDAEENMNLAEQANRVSLKETMVGDVNRTRVTVDVSDIREYRKEYMYQTDRLANMLGVPNLQREHTTLELWSRSGGTYIACPSGIADTSVSSRGVEYFQHLHGGFGW